MQTKKHDMIWANLLHLSINMWFDRRDLFSKGFYGLTEPYLRFDDRLWNDILKHMAGVGMNMVVLDLGDGVRYKSHPEIAVKNAWTTGRLRREIKKMRQMGLEPIPKLNFSAGHDNWLGPYARCVSTPAYYKVCADLIREVSGLFDQPRFFHLGMDEETACNQGYNEYIVIRTGDLWWHDLKFLSDQVVRLGARPWIWADAHWFHGGNYIRHVPKNVVQGNWWYSRMDVRHEMKRSMPELRKAEVKAKPVQTYVDLDQAGYDQIPTASNWSSDDNFKETVAFARRHIAPRHLLGVLQTAWKPTVEVFRQVHMAAIDQVGVEIARWKGLPVRRPVENQDVRISIPAGPGMRVGVYQANPGSNLVVRQLKADPAIKAFLLPRLNGATLRQAEALLISRAPSCYYFNQARSALRQWVHGGGRLILMYDACGWNRFAPPLFPEIGRPVRKDKAAPEIVPVGALMDRAGATKSGHGSRGALCRAWCDHLVLRKGRHGEALARDRTGQPVVIGGRYGQGRVLLSGINVGETAPGAKSAAGGSPQEWQLLRRMLAWLKK